MTRQVNHEDGDIGWSWFSETAPSAHQDEDLAQAVAACLAGSNGDIVIQHLRATFLDRRVAPTASDAELRHIEGQRSAIAYLLRLARPRG
jgi:hypothetical protein